MPDLITGLLHVSAVAHKLAELTFGSFLTALKCEIGFIWTLMEFVLIHLALIIYLEIHQFEV